MEGINGCIIRNLPVRCKAGAHDAILVMFYKAVNAEAAQNSNGRRCRAQIVQRAQFRGIHFGIGGVLYGFLHFFRRLILVVVSSLCCRGIVVRILLCASRLCACNKRKRNYNHQKHT